MSPQMEIAVAEISLQLHQSFSQWLWRMFCIQVVTGGVLKGYVQGAGGPNHYPVYRPLCLLGIDAFI